MLIFFSCFFSKINFNNYNLGNQNIYENAEGKTWKD
jgi:hypothetical protein